MSELIVGKAPGVTPGPALCWVHEARHYKTLVPISWECRALLEASMAPCRGFYAARLAYQRDYGRSGHHDPAQADRLRAWFAALFAAVTG